MSEYLISIDELIRAMCENPDAIHTRTCGPQHRWVWAYIVKQANVDDWGEYGLAIPRDAFSNLMARYAGIDAPAPEDSEVPE